MPGRPGFCDVCGKDVAKTQQCSACKSRAYCGVVCQKADWRAGHKGQCKALRAARAELEGGHVRSQHREAARCPLHEQHRLGPAGKSLQAERTAPRVEVDHRRMLQIPQPGEERLAHTIGCRAHPAGRRAQPAPAQCASGQAQRSAYAGARHANRFGCTRARRFRLAVM